MSSSPLAMQTLKQDALSLITACRNNLKTGIVNVAGIEASVRAYCDSIAKLSNEEARKHKSDLDDLMQHVTDLEHELTAARDAVKQELNTLENVRKAHVAYHHVGTSHPPRDAQDD